MAVINIFIIKMDKITMYNVKGVSNEPRDLLPYLAVLLSSTALYKVFSSECFSGCNFSVLVVKKL